MSIQSLLLALVEQPVEFVVVGGVAGAIQGSPFVTSDLDVCYDTGRANLAGLARLLAKIDAYPRGWESGSPFTADVKTLKTMPILTLRTRDGDLDLLDRIEGVGGYRDVFESSEEINAFGVRFRVLTLDALIRARRASARPKDMAQIPTLEALVEIRMDSANGDGRTN